MKKIKSLAPAQLSSRCDPKQLKFTTTAQLPLLKEPIGQDRAIAAIEFGISMQEKGFNLYLLGPEGTGKHTLIQSVLKKQAHRQPTPKDWCYINNFDSPLQPIAVSFPPGKALGFQKDMNILIDELKIALPPAINNEDLQKMMQALDNQIEEKQQSYLKKIRDKARLAYLQIIRSSQGFKITTIKNKKLTPKQLNYSHQQITVVQDEMVRMLEKISHWRKEKIALQKKLQKDFILAITRNLTKSLFKKYKSYTQIQDYLQAIEKDIVQYTCDLNNWVEKEVSEYFFANYKVNVLVTHKKNAGAPIIYEDFPNQSNLLGKVEYIGQGNLHLTNFSLIKAGALHKANGGYLILDAYKILSQPQSWDILKRALITQVINMELLGQVFGFPNTTLLDPIPIPLEVKIILIGDRNLYYLLSEHDVNFNDLFKVAADFSNHIRRNKRNFSLYARLIATLADQGNLYPLDRGAVARIIDHGSRLANDTKRLTTHMRELTDLLKESHYWSKKSGRNIIKEVDIQQAIQQQIYRANRVETRIHEDLSRNILLIDTRGKKIGQINGLSVMQLGHYAFSIPSRITATVHLGKGELVDIEREVELGGAIHSKGVLILSGFLTSRYLPEKHLSISASLVFEQNYGEVEGDSASAAELAALLSAIAKLPVDQSYAITGSINQYGQVQAIGSINEKIEGFFEACKIKGLTGKQGVIIPESNVQHLMLKEEVVNAAKRKEFFIYAVDNIDQIMEVLTHMPAGKADKNGRFPKNTVNGYIERSLLKFLELAEEEHKNQPEPGEPLTK